MVLSPVGVGIVMVGCFILAGILEYPTNRGAIYSLLTFISILGTVFAPLPCIVSAIAGIVFAMKAKNDDKRSSGWIIAIGIFDILASIVIGLVVVYAVFVGGTSV